MSQVTLEGNAVNLAGNFPKVGDKIADFSLVAQDLSDVSLSSQKAKNIVLNIFPSIDTPVCATSVRKFNEVASQKEDTVVLCISKDLPFAQARFCGAEGLDKVITLSDYRNNDFGNANGVIIADSPLAGILARAVIILNENYEVVYAELVPEITQDPNYDAAIAAL